MRNGLGLVLATLALLVAAPAGCRGGTSDRSLRFVDVESVGEIMQGRKGLFGGREAGGVYVDPRSRSEFVAGHIPVALHVPYESVRAERTRLPGSGAIVVYGSSYDSTIAAAMSKTLIELGFTDVRTLRGGLEVWRDAGHEVARGGD